MNINVLAFLERMWQLRRGGCVAGKRDNLVHGRIKGRNAIPRPLLKWAGGKGQVIDALLARMPPIFNNYYEPFMGGAALFFSLVRQGRLHNRHVYLSDINIELINMYCAVRENVEGVIAALNMYRYDRDQYYKVRALDPRNLPASEAAARMIYLNRTGFNGLYRVNSRGQFNVPFGRYRNPLICDEANLRSVSKALHDVSLQAEPFEKTFERAKKNDFVYLDPPYVPLSETAYFVSYTHQGFTLRDQQRLAEVFADLDRRGVYVMLSNSDTDWVQGNYERYHHEQIRAHRFVNARPDRRGSVTELVVTNYH